MSYYPSSEESKALELIHKLGTIRKDQLVSLDIFEKRSIRSVEEKIRKFEALAEGREKRFNVIDGEYFVPLKDEDINYDMVDCLDIMLSLDKKIPWFSPSEFPFAFTFKTLDTIDGEETTRIYDICKLKPGDEPLVVRAIEQTLADRIITILDVRYIHRYKDIKSYIGNDKKMIYATIDHKDSKKPIKFHNDFSEIIRVFGIRK